MTPSPSSDTPRRKLAFVPVALWGRDAATFHRRCALVALFWLAAIVPIRAHFNDPGTSDFEAYYMGGALAMRGQWDALYPVPRADSTVNPTLASASIIKQEYRDVAAEVNAGTTYLYVQPPPVALLYAALYGWLPLRTAHLLHTLLSILAAWATCLVAGRVVTLLRPSAGRLAGWSILLIAFAPLTLAAIRVANVSVILGALLGAGLLGLLRRGSPALAAAALLTAALLKYVSLIWLPIALLTRRWRILAIAFALGAGLLVLSLFLSGWPVYSEFLSLLPSLSRGVPSGQNQSLMGALHRLFPGPALPAGVASALGWVRWASLVALLALLVSRPRSSWSAPETVCAAAASTLAWFFAFSPLSWNHYAFYFCPFWGWALWECLTLKARAARPFALLGIALTWLPLAGGGRVNLPFPLDSHLLLGVLCFGILGGLRLLEGPVLTPSEAPSPS
jgi:hypothetical protein